MIAILLLAALGAIGLGGALAFGRTTFQAGLILQAAGAAGAGVAGFWTLGSGTTLGTGFASSFDPRFGVDGLSGLFLGTLGLVAAPALVFSLRYVQPTRGGRAVAALTGGLPARARPLRPRPAHLPHRLGADDATLGRSTSASPAARPRPRRSPKPCSG